MRGGGSVEPKTRPSLDVLDVSTWVWPIGACALVYASLLLFEAQAEHAWTLPLSLVLTAVTCVAMVSAIGDATDTLSVHRELRKGTVVYVVTWATWTILGATWKSLAVFAGRPGEVITVLNAALGLLCLAKLNREFKSRNSTAVAALVIAATVFVVPVHTATSFASEELTLRFVLFSSVYFSELIVSILLTGAVDFRFQWCVTSWLLTVSTAASALSVVAIAVEAFWLKLYFDWHKKRNAQEAAASSSLSQSQFPQAGSNGEGNRSAKQMPQYNNNNHVLSTFYTPAPAPAPPLLPVPPPPHLKLTRGSGGETASYDDIARSILLLPAPTRSMSAAHQRTTSARVEEEIRIDVDAGAPPIPPIPSAPPIPYPAPEMSAAEVELALFGLADSGATELLLSTE